MIRKALTAFSAAAFIIAGIVLMIAGCQLQGVDTFQFAGMLATGIVSFLLGLILAEGVTV